MGGAKPRYRFCWWCSRQLYGRSHSVVIVDGREVTVHKSCAPAAQQPAPTARPRGAA